MLAEGFAAVSSDENYSHPFIRYERMKEKKMIDFNSRAPNNMSYNKLFTIREFKSGLSATQETSRGNDKLTYSMLKQSHPTLKK